MFIFHYLLAYDLDQKSLHCSCEKSEKSNLENMTFTAAINSSI